MLEAADGLSHAEIARACDDAAKDCILSERGQVKSQSLVTMLQDRRRIERASSTAVKPDAST